jgi:single-stranded DNA-binding protein
MLRRTGRNIGQYMKKGRPILIEGRLKLDQWDDKQTGQKAQQTRGRARNFSISRFRRRPRR